MPRKDIQALRAFAVLLVVVYHLWEGALPGGFAGVDVFFVISGFLITSHLVREIDRTGTVSLAAFWARRARRILPAALTVLLVCVIATVVLVPHSRWDQFLSEVRASTAYVQNYKLASDAVDYLGASNPTSPVQHFWSLSAEEQFYLAWPIVLLLCAVPARGRRAPLAVAMGALTAASLAYSIGHTAANPAAAYFVTPARAWEFGAGGLLALARPSDAVAAPVRALTGWAGLGAIALTAFSYSETTPFPGAAALLPALGAAAVIWAGAPQVRWAPTPLLAAPPLQRVGDMSYAIYLWHLPLIVLAPFAIGGEAPDRTVMLMLILLAAFLTKLLVEDPLRHGRLLARRDPRWTFAAVGAGTAMVLAAAGNASSELKTQLREAKEAADVVLASRPRCFGAAAREPGHQCSNPRLRLQVVPTPLDARDRPNAPCKLHPPRGLVSVCEFGVPRREAHGEIALIGDSHASHWRAALAVVARAKRWHAVSIARSGCPLTKARKDLKSPQEEADCVEWNRQVQAWLAKHTEIRTVFVSEITGSAWIASGRGEFATAVAGYARAWRALPRRVRRVVVIRDTPKSSDGTHACIERAMDRRRPPGEACALSRREAVQRDPAAVAAARLGARSRVRVVDLNRFICGANRCFPVVGGALVYKDQHHLTAVFAKTLGPYLLRAVDRAL